MTLEGLRLRVRKIYIRFTSKKRGKKIGNKKFTIISNNCWGGLVYESYNLQKDSPTVGMYFAPTEYLKFISNLKHYINECEMEFIDPEKSVHKALYRQDNTFGKYPIAKLGDVEIALLHYHSKNEALSKWRRRCERIHWENIIIKMNDQNGCTKNDMLSFFDMHLECKCKLFFSVKKEWKKINSDIVLINQFNRHHIYASMEPFGASRKCNINSIINRL